MRLAKIMNRAASRWACALNLADCQTAMFRELKLSITDEESHLKMRLDALLSDVMTAGLWATLATVTISLAASRLCTVEEEGQKSHLLVCLWPLPPTAEGLHSHLDAPFCDPRRDVSMSVSVRLDVCTPVMVVVVVVQWPAGSGTFGFVQRRECLWLVSSHPPPLLPFAPAVRFTWYAHDSVSRFPSHRMGGRASQQQAAWSQERRWPVALACLNKGRIGECCELPRVDGLDPTHLKF